MSPLSLIAAVVLFGGLAFGVSMLVYSRVQRHKAFAWYFDRQGGVTTLIGHSYSGLVSHSDGGYVERQDAVIDMVKGRPMFESGDPDWRRSRRPVFFVRSQDSAPLEFSDDGTVKVNNLTDAEYEQRVDLAAELATRDAAHKANRGDLITLMLGATLIILGLSMAGVTAAVVMKGNL